MFRIGGELEIGRMGYGTVQLLDVGVDAHGPIRPNVDPAKFLRKVVELGIDLIDTADLYGPHVLEEQIAAALAPYTANLLISTKGGLKRIAPGKLQADSRPEHLRKAVEGSLRRLRLDVLPLWTLHQIDDAIPVEEIVGTMGDLRREGKIRFLGLSKPDVPTLRRALAVERIESVQNRFNAADQREGEVADFCAAHGIAFQAYFPLAGGQFARLSHCVADIARARGASVQQIALAWLLTRSPAVLPIPGTASIDELEANVAAGAMRLTEAEMDHVAERYAALPPPTDAISQVMVPRVAAG